MEFFAKTINGLKPFNYFAKVCILQVLHGSEYASVNTFDVKRVFIKKDQRFFNSFFLKVIESLRMSPRRHVPPQIGPLNRAYETKYAQGLSMKFYSRLSK